MTGTLGLFSLVDLFQLLASSSRTGRLMVDHPEGAARVYFDKGRVVHADFNGFTGEEAVYALFRDERGSFEFTLGMAAPETSIRGGTENLLLEAIRRLDESQRGAQGATVALSDDAVPAFTDLSATNLTLQPFETAILRFVDGRRDLGRIAADAGADMSEVKAVVARLIQLGALTVRTQKPRVARLVTKLSRDLPAGSVGVDPNLMGGWQRVLSYLPDHIACRRPDGRVDVFRVHPVQGAGPYVLVSRDTLFSSNLAVNVTLLVKPV